MKTTVVNLRKEPYDVYIGRPGKGQSGYFGNPVLSERPCDVCDDIHDRGGTIECFEKWARERIETDPEYRRRVRELAGKTLGCFCKPRRCHGDVLAQMADELAASGRDKYQDALPHDVRGWTPS